MATVKPVLRIFDVGKAFEFYIEWLGFAVDWQHGLEDEPKYIQISLGDITLHLSEHHGDGTPGTHIFIDDCKGLQEYHASVTGKNYKYNKPGLDVPFYDTNSLEMQVYDPFGNRLIFVEREVR